MIEIAVKFFSFGFGFGVAAFAVVIFVAGMRLFMDSF